MIWCDVGYRWVDGRETVSRRRGALALCAHRRRGRTGRALCGRQLMTKRHQNPKMPSKQQQRAFASQCTLDKYVPNHNMASLITGGLPRNRKTGFVFYHPCHPRIRKTSKYEVRIRVVGVLVNLTVKYNCRDAVIATSEAWSGHYTLGNPGSERKATRHLYLGTQSLTLLLFSHWLIIPHSWIKTPAFSIRPVVD